MAEPGEGPPRGAEGSVAQKERLVVGQQPRGGQEGVVPPPQEEPHRTSLIFDDVLEPVYSEEAIKDLGLTNEQKEAVREKIGMLKNFRDVIRDGDKRGLLDAEKAFQSLVEAATQGKIDRAMAQDYMDALAKRALDAVRQRSWERMPEERRIAEEIRRITDRWERLEALKNTIDGLAPDLGPIDQSLLRLIAEDEEAAEMFVDRIISKPLASPDAHYELSWYASINLQAFFTEVSAVNRDRFLKYVDKKEATLRFHEMNRTIISESGNIDAFLGITRTVTPNHIQTVSSEDGVEMVRQLIELAYGRLYAKTNRVTGDNFEPEIMGWVTEQFKQLAKEGVVKSRFKDADGNSRSLEEWEINRAIAFGRNIHASFYRHSELISWSNVPEEFEGWLKSLPTETVVRVMGGLKWLTYRFRVGSVRGGPQLVSLLYDKIKEENYKTNLTKIGALDIRRDILPTGFFRAGGFDKGWRTFWDYLGSDAMRITIPDPEDFPEEVRDGVKKFLDEHNGVKEANLGGFLIRQEYAAQILASEKAKIAGVDLPEELRQYDSDKQKEMVEKVLLRLLGGWRSKNTDKTNHKDYAFNKDDFEYDGSQDQINLSLGVLISFGASSEFVKTILWHKVADFLPLRVAYFLSDEGVEVDSNTGKVKRKLGQVERNGGVKGILEKEKFRQFRGEGKSLFDSVFEGKLIKAQLLRIQAQKNTPNRRINLEKFYDQVGLTDLEKELVGELQNLGRQNARELAKMSFPHIAFLDDVAFQKANYITLGAEVFPRRMGGDFSAYYKTNEAFNGIASNLGQPWEEGIMKGLSGIVDNMSTPEGYLTAQDVALPILQSCLELGAQWVWTRWPVVKTVANFLGKPASHLQAIFGTNAPADDESELNLKAKAAAEKGIIRKEKMPGKEKSQLDELLGKVGGRWYNVLWREIRNALVLYFMLMSFEFAKKTSPGEKISNY